MESYQADVPGMNRAMGDPGTTEMLTLPRYAYIFILQQNGLEWEMMDVVEETLEEEDWETYRYKGYLQATGDSILRYTKILNYLLPRKGVKGRAYGIVSPIDLTGYFNTDIRAIDDLTELLDLKLRLTDETILENIQNIYSTPYNYETGSPAEYYCTFDNTYSNVASVELMLYHIAAKVDLQWSVAAEKRKNANPAEVVRLTYMEVQHLYADNTLVFRPLENELADKVSTGYSKPNIVTATDAGMWWEGRAYFYTIPYTTTGRPGYFPLQMVMRTNGSEGTGYRPTLYLKVDTESPFVPWMRADFNINAPMSDGEDTKVIDS